MSSYQQYGGNPYGGDSGSNRYESDQYQTSNPYEGGGYSTQPAGAQGSGLLGSGPAPPATLQHEASNYSQASQYSQQGRVEQGYGEGYGAPATSAPAATSAPLSNNDFLARIDSVKRQISRLTSNVSEIATLHQRRIASPDNSNSSALEAHITETQILNTGIKDDIKSLERDQLRDPNNSIKKTQIKTLKETFQRQLQEYQRQENDYEKRYREAIGRQYRIVNPEATESEVREAENANWGNEGVFQTALKTNRVGHASSVLGNVRARHNDIMAIEKSMVELAQLFQQLDEQVVLQEETVKDIEDSAATTNVNVTKGNEQIDVAIDHARRARRLKWWLTGVIVLIILILAAVLGGVFGSRAANAPAAQPTNR